LEDNLTSPEDLEEYERKYVVIQFIVGYDGKLKGFEVVKDGGAAFNKEVVRVLKKMPNWTPGKTKGKNVTAYHTLPVTFVATE
jgi:periplasmic protein TonB